MNTIMVALKNLEPKLNPLICLFSQMILVGSAAEMNTGSAPKIYSLSKPSITGSWSEVKLQFIFFEYLKASM